MSLNGVSGYSQIDAYAAYQTTAKTAVASDTADAKTTEGSGVVYEPSEQAKTYTSNTEIVDMLKADAESYQNQLLSYVQQAVTGQGNTIAAADDVWKFLASGNFTVSEAAKAEAQAALEDGGYWSVDATSDRIIQMAKALTGGDPSKIEEMREAFEKGYKEATKTWGKELPEISSKTYDAVMEKFDAWAAEDN